MQKSYAAILNGFSLPVNLPSEIDSLILDPLKNTFLQF